MQLVYALSLHIAVGKNRPNVLTCLDVVSLSSQHRLTESHSSVIRYKTLRGHVRHCSITARRVPVLEVINWTYIYGFNSVVV